MNLMKALKWINTGAFLSMILVNALAELVPIGGNTTGQVSEAYPNLFTPAPITFAIWGVIYVMMLLFTLYQLGILDGNRQSETIRERVGPWFAVSCVLNILWIILWHTRLIGWSVVCIAMLLFALHVILYQLRDISGGILLKLAARTGFSLYYGWIIAAAIANISAFLTQLRWNGWGLSADFWTVVVLLAGTAITWMVIVYEKNRIAAISVMWAYAGILIRHISPAYYGGAHPYVIAAAIVCEVLILTAILIPTCQQAYRKRATLACRSQQDSIIR